MLVVTIPLPRFRVPHLFLFNVRNSSTSGVSALRKRLKEVGFATIVRRRGKSQEDRRLEGEVIDV